MIIQAAVTRSDLKRFTEISLINHLQFLAMPTSRTADAMDWKIFPDTMQLLTN